MNYKVVGKFISEILIVELVFMIPALLISVFCGETSSIFGFLGAMLATSLISLVLYLLCRKAKKRFFAKEGLVCVGMGWIALSILGALPFFISREIPSFVDALFENCIRFYNIQEHQFLTNVEAMSKGMLYWRSFSHWLRWDGCPCILTCHCTGRWKKLTDSQCILLRAESPGPNSR